MDISYENLMQNIIQCEFISYSVVRMAYHNRVHIIIVRPSKYNMGEHSDRRDKAVIPNDNDK
jgi:hypothetical protein